MKISLLQKVMMQEDLNFLLTNRIPRLAATRFMGWLSKIESPLFTRCAIAVWRLFTDLDLSEAKEHRFNSLQACFTRELKAGARTVDMSSDVMSSPCDAIVGECGAVQGRTVFQAKGFPYTTTDLFGPTQDASVFEDGVFVTLRLTSAMYHRFHAPCSGQIESAKHFPGDAWNVNPETLERVDRLFVKNERACLTYRMQDGQTMALVPVAAILVAGIRVHALNGCDWMLKEQPTRLSPPAPYTKAQEMGWFEHGSTILMIVPKNYRLRADLQQGDRLKMGQALLFKQDICA